MAGFNLKDFRDILLETAKAIRDMKGDQADLAKVTDDLNKKFAESNKQNETAIQLAEQRQASTKKLVENIKDGNSELNNQTKRADEAEKAIAKLTKSNAALKSKLQEANKDLKQQSQELSTSFKATTKDMAAMLREAFMGGSGKGKNKDSIKNFFTSQFSGLATAITSELKNLKLNTVSIGLDIGESLQKGLAAGVKGSGSQRSIGIGDLVQANIQNEIQKVQNKVKREIRKIAGEIGLQTTEGLQAAMKEVAEGRKSTKDLLAFDVFNKWGSPENRTKYKNAFKDQLNDLKNHLKDVQKMTQNHDLEMTAKQKENVAKIQKLAADARKMASVGMAGGASIAGMNVSGVANINKEIADLKEKHQKSLQHSSELSAAWKKMRADEIAAALHEDKVDERLMQDRIHRQQKLTKMISNDVKTQMQELNKLTTGQSSGKATSGLGKKKSDFTVKTDEEAAILRHVQFLNQAMKNLRNNERISFDERKAMAKEFSDQYKQGTAQLVNLINERVAAEKEAAKKQAEIAAGQIKQQRDKQQFEEDQLKNINAALKANQRDFEKAESDKLKARQEFSEYHLKAEQKLQEELRRLTGRFTEKEKYTKSKKYLEVSMNDQVKAEVEQAKKIETIMKAYERARSRSTRGNDMDAYYQKSADALLAYAQKEKNVLQEMIYGRLNANKMLAAEQKKANREKLADDAKLAQSERDRIRNIARDERQRLREQRESAKAAYEQAKQMQKAQSDAAKASKKAWSEMFDALGLGWRNRNMMESFQQFSHSIRRFGHDIGVMAQTVARHLVYITGSIAAFGAGVAAALAMASKKMYDFGSEIIKTTEEVRSYNIALYGMMNTQSGVNEMMQVAEKVTKDMPIGFKTIQESVKGLVLIGPVRDMLRNTQDIEKVMGSLFKIVVGLSQIQPEWGAKGAIFSLRNALTGDLRSLQRRFELPVRAIYSAEGVPLQNLQYQPEKMVETLDTYISSFYSSETLKMSSDQFSAIMEKMTGNWIKFVSSIGESGFYDTVMKDFKAVRDLIEDFVSGPNFGAVTKSISDAMANMYTSVRNVATYFSGGLMELFGIEKNNSTDALVAVFEQIAKSIKYVEKMITSGNLKQVVIDLGDSLYRRLLVPIKETKNVLGEMIQDALRFGKYFSESLDSISQTISGSGLDEKTFKKGILWTALFGPSNVAMLLGSVALFGNSILGLIANTFNVLKTMVVVFQTSWIGAWMSPFLIIPLKIMAVLGLLKGFGKLLSDPDAAESFGKTLYKVLSDVGDAFKGIFEDVFIYIAQRINDLAPRLAKFFGLDVYQNVSNVGDRIKENEERIAAIKKGQLTESTISENAEGSLYGKFRKFVFPWENTKNFSSNKEIKKLEEENKRLRDIHSYNRKDYTLLGSVGGGMVNFTERVANLGMDVFKEIFDFAKNGMSPYIEQITNAKRKMLETYTLSGANIDKLKPEAISGVVDVIDILKNAGLSPYITSAYRSEKHPIEAAKIKAGGLPGVHTSGYAVDFQANWSKEQATPILQSLLPLVEQGIIKKIIAEDSAAGGGIFAGSSMIDYKNIFYDTSKSIEKGNSALHVEFAKEFKDQDLGKMVDNAIESAKNLVSGMISADNELESFQGIQSGFVFERGGEFMRSLDNLEIGMEFVTKALEMRYKKMTGLVQSTFEELKDEDGHLFGPEAIEKLEASYKAEAVNRKKTFDKIRADVQRDMLSGKISSTNVEAVVMGRAYDEIRLRQMGSGLDTSAPAFMKEAYPQVVEQMLAGMASGRMDGGLGMGVGFASAMQKSSGGFAANLGKQAQQANEEASELVYNYEEFQKRFRQTIEMSKKYSGEFLQDKLVERTYDLIKIPFDLAQETFSRSFDTKALEEALALTNAIFANFAATDKLISEASNKYVNMIANGSTEAEALEGAIKTYVGSGGKDVSSAIAFLDTLKKQRDVIIETLKPLEQQRNAYARMTNDLKKMNMEELKASKSRYLQSSNANVRKAWGQDYESRIAEGIESDSIGNMFSTGIDIAMAEWDNFGTIVVNSGKTIANDLRQSFEDGFFDVMTGKLQGFREMFKNIGNTILQTIYKIIAQMAAISTTEIILGVNIQGAIGGGKSSAGSIGGVLSSALGGGSSGGIGGIFSGLLGSFGISSIAGSANKDIVSKAMTTGTNIMGAGAGIDLTSLTSAGMGAAIAGSKGTGLLGKLTPVKEWISANALPLLGVAAVGSFLSQPGRVFGGSKDKTGDAKAAYSSYTEQRNNMLNRRASDAISYYMGNSSLSNFSFGDIGYSTWSSGDGWFKGPKEKHAAADPSAFLKSMETYYSMMMDAGKRHYQKMFEINKLSETNSLESLKQQQSFDTQKLALIQAEYARYASSSYTGTDKWDKMDEYRNSVLDQEYANMQLQNEVAKVAKETKYAEMQYLTYIKSNGEDQIAMQKTNIEIEKLKIAELTENTLEWYNAKMALMDSEKELSNSLKESAEALQKNISAGVKEIYAMGAKSLTSTSYLKLDNRLYPRTTNKTTQQTAVEYAGLLKGIDQIESGNYTAADLIGVKQTGSRMTDSYEWKEIGKYQYQDLGFFGTTFPNNSKYFDNPNYRVDTNVVDSATPVSQKITNPSTKITYGDKTYKYGDTITWDKDIIETVYQKEYLTEALYSVGDLVNVTLEEAAAYIKDKMENDAENFLANYKLTVQKVEIYEGISNLLNNVNTNLQDSYDRLVRVKNNYELDKNLGLMTEDELKIATGELDVELATLYNDMASSISEWIKAGYISVEDSAVTAFGDAVSSGFNDMSMAYYESLQDAAQKASFKNNVYSAIKDMDDFSLFNQVMNMSEMGDFKNILGLNGVGTGQLQLGDPYVSGFSRNSSGQIKPLYSQDEFEIMDYGVGYDDPYQMWFDFNKKQIETRIANTKGKEGMEEEYYQAEYDLFGLMIENAERLKQKAEEVNRSIEDMLGKIEETMRMRIAEERETSKGDVYFIDAGATRNSQKMLDDMLAKVQTNDPAARQLIEEFRKKMMGIK